MFGGRGNRANKSCMCGWGELRRENDGRAALHGDTTLPADAPIFFLCVIAGYPSINRPPPHPQFTLFLPLPQPWTPPLSPFFYLEREIHRESDGFPGMAPEMDVGMSMGMGRMPMSMVSMDGGSFFCGLPSDGLPIDDLLDFSHQDVIFDSPPRGYVAETHQPQHLPSHDYSAAFNASDFSDDLYVPVSSLKTSSPSAIFSPSR